MPDVFERYFSKFGYKVSDLYKLHKLDPSFRIFYGENDIVDVPNDSTDLKILFESIEEGAGDKLTIFLKEAEYKYNVGIKDLVYQPGLSIFEFANSSIIKGVIKLQVFTSFSKHVRKFFTNPKLIALMEFPVLFLGAMPKDTPALYSLMNYAGLKLGTWYPEGGFGSVIKAMHKVAIEQGVIIHTNSTVEKLPTKNSKITHINVNNQNIDIDDVIATADYHHIEQEVLDLKDRTYTEEYWNSRTLAPSSLIFYLGINKKLNALEHHNLFFHSDFNEHAEEIYKDPKWPTDPLFYVCCPSKTDKTVAPENQENIFILIPIAPGIEDTQEIRDLYYNKTISRLESLTGESIKDNIIYKKDYCVNDFKTDYNSYKGNAYGLANTLMQTAILKPKLKSKKVKNLYYAGHLTVPGPGVPPSIISGEIAVKELLKK
jgi:phytoene desaturase